MLLFFLCFIIVWYCSVACHCICLSCYYIFLYFRTTFTYILYKYTYTCIHIVVIQSSTYSFLLSLILILCLRCQIDGYRCHFNFITSIVFYSTSFEIRVIQTFRGWQTISWRQTQHTLYQIYSFSTQMRGEFGNI